MPVTLFAEKRNHDGFCDARNGPSLVVGGQREAGSEESRHRCERSKAADVVTEELRPGAIVANGRVRTMNRQTRPRARSKLSPPATMAGAAVGAEHCRSILLSLSSRCIRRSPTIRLMNMLLIKA